MNCPKCDRPMQFETIETEFDGDTYYDYNYGFCNHCNKGWKWTSIYRFFGIMEIEEVNPDDHL